MALNDKPIQARSTHQIGDMYIHKKHKFIVKIVGRGHTGWGRQVKVMKGDVPEVVMQRVSFYTTDNDEKLLIDYSTCALVNCFDRLKSGQVLFG